MKSCLCALLLLAVNSTVSHAGNVLVINFSEENGRQLPITTSGGFPIFHGGVVQIGTFATADPSGVISGLVDNEGLAALLSDFIAFGASTRIGSDFDGLYASYASASISADSPLVGKSIYTLIGNGSMLANSTEFGIVRHPATFTADNPTFQSLADISDPAATILYGGVGPGVPTALGLSSSSLRIGIPEPSSAILLLFGIAATLVPRRPTNRF